MTLPSSPNSINLGQVNTELSRSVTATINLNEAQVRTLAGVGVSGTIISMNDLRGKSFYNGTLVFNNTSLVYVPNGSPASMTLQSNGAIIYDWSGQNPEGPTAYLSPLAAGAGALYEARLVGWYMEGYEEAPVGSVFGVTKTAQFTNETTPWVNLSQNRVISLNYVSTSNAYANVSFNLEIRKIGTISPVIARSCVLATFSNQ